MPAVVDLHVHTTASDGRCSPAVLVERAIAAGVTVMAVTDHDTTAAFDEVTRAADGRGLQIIPGIEITAVENGRDVHVLGYFVPTDIDGPLAQFLVVQREARIARAVAIGERLATLGVPIDTEALVADARSRPGRSLGRPLIARAMVAAGHVADISEAFDTWLGTGCPAFVSRSGPGVADVIAIVHRAGGLVSLAHPGRTRIDARIEEFRDAGLDAIEVYHCDHDAVMADRYRRQARDLDLLVSGGSDFHGDPSHGQEPGAAHLPPAQWERLHAARDRHAHRE